MTTTPVDSETKAKVAKAMEGFYSRTTAAVVLYNLWLCSQGPHDISGISLHEIGKAIARLAKNSPEWDDDEKQIGLISSALVKDVGYDYDNELQQVAEYGESGNFPGFSPEVLGLSLGWLLDQNHPEWQRLGSGAAIKEIARGMRDQIAWRIGPID